MEHYSIYQASRLGPELSPRPLTKGPSQLEMLMGVRLKEAW